MYLHIIIIRSPDNVVNIRYRTKDDFLFRHFISNDRYSQTDE